MGAVFIKDTKEKGMIMNNKMKFCFSRSVADRTSPLLTDCEAYGMMFGCDEDCPVLINGKCELYSSVNEFLEEKELVKE